MQPLPGPRQLRPVQVWLWTRLQAWTWVFRALSTVSPTTGPRGPRPRSPAREEALEAGLQTPRVSPCCVDLTAVHTARPTHPLPSGGGAGGLPAPPPGRASALRPSSAAQPPAGPRPPAPCPLPTPPSSRDPGLRPCQAQPWPMPRGPQGRGASCGRAGWSSEPTCPLCDPRPSPPLSPSPPEPRPHLLVQPPLGPRCCLQDKRKPRFRDRGGGDQVLPQEGRASAKVWAEPGSCQPASPIQAWPL